MTLKPFLVLSFLDVDNHLMKREMSNHVEIEDSHENNQRDRDELDSVTDSLIIFNLFS